MLSSTTCLRYFYVVIVDRCVCQYLSLAQWSINWSFIARLQPQNPRHFAWQPSMWSSQTLRSRVCSRNLTLWRRNYFLILAHPVYKMWIIQEPNTLELWNKQTHTEQEQYNPWNNSTNKSQAPEDDVITFETCWAVNSEIIKQVTSSWFIFNSCKSTVSCNCNCYRNPCIVFGEEIFGRNDFHIKLSVY